jgi:uncharacterized protein YggE
MKFFTFLTAIMIGATALGAGSEHDLHLIFVNGVAEKTVEPDMIAVRLESWAKSNVASKAQEQQAAQFAKLKNGLEKFRIKKEDIQTEAYSVNPEYVYDQKSQQSKINGYRVSHVVMVIYRKIDDVGSFLDSMVTSRGESSGISVQNISWDSSKKAEVEVAALAEAVKNARQKASQLASAAGVQIKAVHRIQHSSGTPPGPQPMMFEAAAMKMGGAAPQTELSAGQIKVRVDVQMEFEI